MTAAVVASPLLGAAAVNGLCGALVLNNVPCGCDHGRERFYERECSRCAGTGFVAPEVTPGQHLAVITTRDAFPPFLTVENEHGSMRTFELHLGSVIGSVTATTPALPIVAERDSTIEMQEAEIPALVVVEHDRLQEVFPRPSLVAFGVDPSDYGKGLDLSEWLPWLGDDLVGRWAVLTDNPTATEQRCPNPQCEGGWVLDCDDCAAEGLSLADTDCSASGCRTCWRAGHCAPVPLPDGVDLTEGTLVEVDL